MSLAVAVAAPAIGAAIAVVLAACGLLVIWIVRGYSRPSIVLVLEGFQMWVLAPVWPILVGAAVAGWWWAVVLAVPIAVAHLWWCVEAVRPAPRPAWVDGAPHLTVFAANVLYVNPRTEAMAAAVLAVDADVVVLNETTPALRELLARHGSHERYPTRSSTAGRPFDETIWTRLAADDVRIEVLGGQWVPAVTVDVGGRPVRVFAIHAKAPKRAAERQAWRRHLEAFGMSAASADGRPRVYAGDFNAAPWHGPFRRMLSAGRLRSVHRLAGRGLSRSWTPRRPPVSWLGPLMRLDHVLVTDELFPVELRDVVIPGSDHRGVLVRLAVRPA